MLSHTDGQVKGGQTHNQLIIKKRQMMKDTMATIRVKILKNMIKIYNLRQKKKDAPRSTEKI